MRTRTLTLVQGAHVHLPNEVQLAVGLDALRVAQCNLAKHSIIEVRAVALGVARSRALRLRRERARRRAESQRAVFVGHEDARVGCGRVRGSVSVWDLLALVRMGDAPALIVLKLMPGLGGEGRAGAGALSTPPAVVGLVSLGGEVLPSELLPFLRSALLRR